MTMDPNSFYEDDEPVEEVVAAFERGRKGVTERPVQGFNEVLQVPGLPPILTKASNQTLNTANSQ